MTTKRIKIPEHIITRARAEELLGEIATLTIRRRAEQNEMDARLTQVRETFEGSLSILTKEIEEKSVLLESWASANPEEFPKDRKSLEMVHGVIGFRTGTPKVETLRGWTWKRVLENLQRLGKPVAGFIRTKEEVNKEAMIASSSAGYLDAATARHIGVQVVQEESFFVEPKLEDQETRKVVEMKGAAA